MVHPKGCFRVNIPPKPQPPHHKDPQRLRCGLNRHIDLVIHGRNNDPKSTLLNILSHPLSLENMYTELIQGIGWMYGIIVMLGGAIGYLQAGSTMSLYAGVGSGFLALIGGILITKSCPSQIDTGLKMLLAVSIGLIYVFQRRLQETNFKFMPSGFMILNSLAILVLAALALKERASSPKAPEKTNKRKNN